MVKPQANLQCKQEELYVICLEEITSEFQQEIKSWQISRKRHDILASLLKKKLATEQKKKWALGLLQKLKVRKWGKKGTHRDMMSFKPNKEEKKIWVEDQHDWTRLQK